MMNIIDIIGYIAAVCTTVSFLPQVIQTFQSKRTKDISLPMYAILTLGAVLWFVYGVLAHALPIIVTNGLIVILASCILVLKIKHG